MGQTLLDHRSFGIHTRTTQKKRIHSPAGGTEEASPLFTMEIVEVVAVVAAVVVVVVEASNWLPVICCYLPDISFHVLVTRSSQSLVVSCQFGVRCC